MHWFHYSYAWPGLIHNVPLCLWKCRKINSSHREDLTFNRKLWGAGLSSDIRTNICGNAEDQFFRRLRHFFLESFSWILHSSSFIAERGQNELIWLFFGWVWINRILFPSSEQGRLALRAEGCNHLRQAEHAICLGLEGFWFQCSIISCINSK